MTLRGAVTPMATDAGNIASVAWKVAESSPALVILLAALVMFLRHLRGKDDNHARQLKAKDDAHAKQMQEVIRALTGGEGRGGVAPASTREGGKR